MSQAIEHLKRAIDEGKHWYIALLEAIGLWTRPEEDYDGRHYQYLVAREAFDWALLAERLCHELDGLVPREERIDLIFGKPPLDIPPRRFKELIGPEKYRAFLNYFYGVIVEQALQMAVEIEIEKELHGKVNNHDSREAAFQRIYGSGETALLKRFRKVRGYPQTRRINLSEITEFTYWLFKYRFINCDNARVASDTRKALKLLEEWKVIQDDEGH